MFTVRNDYTWWFVTFWLRYGAKVHRS